MNHLQVRLNERKITDININDLYIYAKTCQEDSAILIKKLDKIENDCILDFHDRNFSNGDLVILIVRNQKPYTIMFRRSNQPFTAEAMRVNQVLDYTVQKGCVTMTTNKIVTKTVKEQELESKIKSAILTCHICTLGQVKKVCSNCPFNVGLDFPVEVKTIVTL